MTRQIQVLTEAVEKIQRVAKVASQANEGTLEGSYLNFSLREIVQTLTNLSADLEQVVDLLDRQFPPTLQDRCEQFVSGSLSVEDFDTMLYEMSSKDGIVDHKAECLLGVITILWEHSITMTPTMREVVKLITKDWWK